MNRLDIEQSVVMDPKRASDLVEEVEELIVSGDPESAWGRVQRLHSADVGHILSVLPGTARGALVEVMSPDTAAWVLSRLNPAAASRVAGRLGSNMMSLVLNQAPRVEAARILKRLPIPRERTAPASLTNRSSTRWRWTTIRIRPAR